MSKGRIWPGEWKGFKDPVSGVNIKQLTDHKGHSHHVYFTNSGWYDNDQKLLFGSDRENRTNLFSIDLGSGEITQLTDLEPVAPPHEVGFLGLCVDPTGDVAYFVYSRKVMALDLSTLEMRPLWEVPDGFLKSMMNCTADGKYICLGITEDLSDRIRIDYGRGYVGFSETWEAHPLCRIMRIAAEGSGAEIVWEEKTWIGHVNTSPTRANLLTFCHEGPWDKVDNRMWVLDMDTQKTTKLRPRQENENVGHEYWLTDGETIGFHGRWPDGNWILGKIRYDGTEHVEFNVPVETGHMHSNDFSMIVGDGWGFEYLGGCVLVWQYDGNKLKGPRVLCQHRCSFNVQIVHVHPRFTTNGSQVLFTSDMSGYGNMYLAEVPEFGSLPEVKDTE